MKKEVLDRAKKLEDNIKNLKDCLNKEKYGSITWVGLLRRCTYIEFPEEMNDDIRDLINKYIEKYEKELEEL